MAEHYAAAIGDSGRTRTYNLLLGIGPISFKHKKRVFKIHSFKSKWPWKLHFHFHYFTIRKFTSSYRLKNAIVNQIEETITCNCNLLYI